jgi:hypothetical protein
MTLQQFSGLVGPEVATVAELSGENFNEQQLGRGAPEGEPAVPPRVILDLFEPMPHFFFFHGEVFSGASLR